MKKAIKTIYIGLYQWQNEKWGQSNLPALTAILLLSAMQFVNIGCILLIVQTITRFDIFGYLSDHLFIGLIFQILILFLDFQIIKPVKETIKGSYSKARSITAIYTIATFLLLGISLYIGRRHA